jgi:DNA-binding NtrC family response regulator
MGRPLAALTSEARDVLLTHDWPGNVRELQNAIERALVLSSAPREGRCGQEWK